MPTGGYAPSGGWSRRTRYRVRFNRGSYRTD